MNKDKFCFFLSKYNLSTDKDIFCTYDRKSKPRIICEKCPFFIHETEARIMIRRFVTERGLNNEN